METKNIINITINPNLNVSGSIRTLYNNYSAFQIRDELKRTNIDQFIEKEKAKISNKQPTNFMIKNIDNLDDTLELSYDFKDLKPIQNSDEIYLNAISFGEFKTNPFESNIRYSPISFGCPRKETILINYSIPEGYTIESIPKEVNIELPQKAGLFAFTSKHNSQKVTISSFIDIYKSDFGVEEYTQLREFYNTIINYQAQQIILKKL